MSRGFEDFFHWRGGSFHWHGGFTVERTARLPGGGQGRGPAQSCEGRGPPSLHPPPWPRYTLRVLAGVCGARSLRSHRWRRVLPECVLFVCLLRGLAHSVRSACGAARACSLRSLRVRGCGGLLTPFAPRAVLRGLAHSVRSACGAAWACSLRSLRVRGCGACSLRSLRVQGCGRFVGFCICGRSFSFPKRLRRFRSKRSLTG